MVHRQLRLLCILLALVCTTATGCTSQESSSSTESGETVATDEQMADLAMAYMLGEDTSEEAAAAAECTQARPLAGIAADLGPRSVDLVGMSAAGVYAFVRETGDYPGADDSLLKLCPSGGEYGIRVFVRTTLNDGTELWTQEVSCSVHTPEAFAEYEAQLK